MDLISRQAAIDVLKNRWKKTRNYEGIGDDIAEECELYLKQVPPAQPSVSKEEMVGDTISRQAAIKAICEDGTMFERQGKYTMTMAERKQKDADILDSLPSARPGWIPVTEKPIEGGQYIVTLKDDKEVWTDIAEWNPTFGGRWQAEFFDCEYCDIDNVLAWQPLPTPYREGGQDGTD